MADVEAAEVVETGCRGPGDRQHFAEIVEAELIGLHEGNFARYRIRPSEFAAWRQVWEAR
jgi:hypothetical protein